MKTPKQRVAIIGSGISGIVAAYLLDKKYDVTLIEASSRLGGHTNTISVEDPVRGKIGIDTGFIVFNLKNYPLFMRFLSCLNVRYQDSDMSFGFWDETQPFWYASDFPKGVFSNYTNIFSIKFWRFLFEIKQFNRMILQDLEQDKIGNLSLKTYLNEKKLTPFFKESYVLPMGAAIWSCPVNQIVEFPAKPFFMFWKNHHLLTIGKRPIWKTVSNGSQQYISQFLNQFHGSIIKGSPVICVKKRQNGVDITLKNKDVLHFDYVMIATHADQALAMLKNPTETQNRLLGAWSYAKNHVCLHTDTTVMPPRRQAWASWLVKHMNNKNLVMTYYMNRLQQLNTPIDYFVTLNHMDTIAKEKIIKVIDYTHPIYDHQSLRSQKELPLLNESPIFFCGSYFGNGFHEDGVRSAVDACKHLGVEW